MTNPLSPSLLPHHNLIAYQVAVEFLRAVQAASVRDTKLRDEATRAAKGACLNIAEGSARLSRADRTRVFGIARAELVEAIAAVEIASMCGDTTAQHAATCVALGRRTYALLTGLIR